MGWLAGVFALLLLLFIALYRKSLKESRDLTNFALLILMDEGVRTNQRKASRFGCGPTSDIINSICPMSRSV